MIERFKQFIKSPVGLVTVVLVVAMIGYLLWKGRSKSAAPSTVSPIINEATGQLIDPISGQVIQTQGPPGATGNPGPSGDPGPYVPIGSPIVGPGPTGPGGLPINIGPGGDNSGPPIHGHNPIDPLLNPPPPPAPTTPPTPAPQPAPAQYVTVESWPGTDSTLWGIASSHGLSIAQLLALPNNAQYRSHPDLIYPGDQVQIA